MQEETKRVLLSLRERLVSMSEEYEREANRLVASSKAIHAAMHIGKSRGVESAVIEIDRILHCSEDFETYCKKKQEEKKG